MKKRAAKSDDARCLMTLQDNLSKSWAHARLCVRQGSAVYTHALTRCVRSVCFLDACIEPTLTIGGNAHGE